MKLVGVVNELIVRDEQDVGILRVSVFAEKAIEPSVPPESSYVFMIG